MAKNVTKKVKLQIKAGQATAAPPVGTILGPSGINLGEFCSRFNEETKDKMGDTLPVEISIFEDRSFDFVVKTPPAAFLIKKFAKIDKASSKGANEIVATLSQKDIEEIANIKLQDLNSYDIEAAVKEIEGTARNMGVAIKGVNDAELAEQAEEAKKQEIELARREAELEKMEEEAQNISEPEVTEQSDDEEVEETEEAKETKEKEE